MFIWSFQARPGPTPRDALAENEDIFADLLIYTLIAFFLALCFFNFGYDGSVVGGVIAMPTFIADFSNAPKAVLPAQDTSIITSVPIIGSIVGTIAAGWTGDILGRKKSLWIAALINAIGSAIQTAAMNVAMMTAGRAVASKRRCHYRLRLCARGDLC